MSEIPTPSPTPLPNSDATSDDTIRFNQNFYKTLKNDLKITSKNNGLNALADVVLPKESVEIRLYFFASFYAPIYKGVPMDEGIIILRRDNGVWSGKAIRNILKSNSGKENAKERITEVLTQPKSGWDNLWQYLQATRILEKPITFESEVKTDLALYVIESKGDGKYNYSYFHSPKENGSNDEERRIATIFNLIAQEFNASDFKAN